MLPPVLQGKVVSLSELSQAVSISKFMSLGAIPAMEVDISFIMTLRVHSNRQGRLQDREDVVIMIEGSQTGGKHRVDKIQFTIYVYQSR